MAVVYTLLFAPGDCIRRCSEDIAKENNEHFYGEEEKENMIRI